MDSAQSRALLRLFAVLVEIAENGKEEEAPSDALRGRETNEGRQAGANTHTRE